MINGVIPEDKTFILLGRYSKKAFDRFKVEELPAIILQYKNKLNTQWNDFIQEYQTIKEDSSSFYFFASFAYDQLEVGMKFNRIFRIGHEDNIIECAAEILAFLNEFTLLAMPFVGRMHRSICLIRFKEIPAFINEMIEIECYSGKTNCNVGLFYSSR